MSVFLSIQNFLHIVNVLIHLIDKALRRGMKQKQPTVLLLTDIVSVLECVLIVHVRFLRIAEFFAGTQTVTTPEERYTSITIRLFQIYVWVGIVGGLGLAPSWDYHLTDLFTTVVVLRYQP